MQNAVRSNVSLCAFLWWNEETKSNRENNRPEPKESRTWSTRGIGSWLSLLIRFSYLLFTVILTPPDIFGMTTSGFESGEVECWISPAAR